jgi:uncharacterized surface protein with fasciclin (FAS1) repeats
MHLPTSLTLLALSITVSAQGVTLFEGLVNANASKFAQFIQSDPNLVAIFTSPNVKTVYAPTDDAVADFNSSNFRRSLHLYTRQHSSQGAHEQTTNSVTTTAQQQAPGGAVVPSNNPTDGGGSSPIVAKGTAPPASGNGTTKRQVSGGPIYLYTGLGNNVTIIKGDTPFDGGLIHTTSGFFTVPVSFSETLATNGISNFTSALTSQNSTNLTNTINTPATNGVTVFVPSDAAFSAAGGAGNVNLANHIIPNFLGVTPNLKDGLELTTQAGTTVTVSVKGGEIFLGSARILANDVITSNGAIQVIDKVLTPVTPVFVGAAAGKTRSTFATTLSVIISLGFARFMM